MMRVARLRQQINAANNRAAKTTRANEGQAAENPAKTAAAGSNGDANAAKPPAVEAREAEPTTIASNQKPQPIKAPAAGEAETSSTTTEWRGPAEPVDQSSTNLLNIAYALDEYSNSQLNQRLPISYDHDDDAGELSWRVHLLPYLGYEELYNKFMLSTHWDREPNKSLIDQIPAVYQSDGVKGPYTRYLAVTGEGTVMGARFPVRRVALKNGLENTVLVVEADSPRATIWTKPDDLDIDSASAMRKIGRLRGGFTYAVWADATIDALDMSKPRDALMSVFRYGGQGGVTRAEVTAPLDAESMAARGLGVGRNAGAIASFQDGGPSTPASPSDEVDLGNGSGGPLASGAAAQSSPNLLASNCLAAARRSRAAGSATESWRWLFGATTADLPADAWSNDVKWVPGLKRPSLGLHWAVGMVAGTRPTSSRSTGPRYQDANRSRDEILRATAPFGGELLPVIEKAADVAQPASLRIDDEEDALPAVTYLPPSSSTSDLVDRAAAAGADLVVLFSIDVGSGGRSRSGEMVIYDVVQRRQLRRFSGMQSRAGQGAAATQEQIKKVRWELGDYVEDALAPASWPVRLTPGIAEKRVRALGETKSAYAPKQIAEMRYYRGLGLIDDAELLRAMARLIGNDQAIDLMLGSDAKKRRVLREWLPNDDPAAYLAANQLAKRLREDDDD
ncbi:MAG: DUF1559 domain-containing protein [Planctomycetota bacterium]